MFQIYIPGFTTTIRRTAVREADMFQHHRSTINGSPKTPQTSLHDGIDEFKEHLERVPR